MSRRHFAGRSVIPPRSDESVVFAVCQAGVDNELGMAVSYAVPAWEGGRPKCDWMLGCESVSCRGPVRGGEDCASWRG